MIQEMKSLLEDYVMTDRLYKLELDKEFSPNNRLEEFEECRNNAAIRLANALAKETGYFEATTKRLYFGFWVKEGEKVEDYEKINLDDCLLNYYRSGRTVVINNGKITDVE